MANKAQRIVESIIENAGLEVYESVIRACGSLEENAAPNRQSRYVKGVLGELESAYGPELASKVMKPCGHKCISDGVIKKAKAMYVKSENLDEFLELLNGQHIGGGRLYASDGKIIGVYEKCYCGLPKYVKGLSPAYCSCSSGWFEKLFTDVFEKDVEVKKLQTILEGADRCIFEINPLRYTAKG